MACRVQNVVLYAGTAADRQAIRDYELEYVYDNKSRNVRGVKQWKFTVLLTSYETVRQEAGLFQSITWATVIIDEAHRCVHVK